MAETAAWRERRARRYEKKGHRWHRSRARGIRARAERIYSCGVNVGLQSRCAQGHRVVFAARCGDRNVCPSCARRASQRHYARMARSMGAAARSAPRGHRLVLATFTVDHDGAVEDRADALRRAWARWRSWFDSKVNPRGRRRRKVRWWSTYECTEGKDGRGHPHLHVVLLAPWFDWSGAQRAWQRATRGRAGARGAWFRVAGGDPARAARYVSKYVGKGSAGLSIETAARWWEASYGRRVVGAYRGAWLPAPAPRCPCCGTADVDFKWSPGAPLDCAEVAPYAAGAPDRGGG